MPNNVYQQYNAYKKIFVYGKKILVGIYRTKDKMSCAEVMFYENFEKGLKTDPFEKKSP